MVTIYGAGWCGFCLAAKELCENYSLSYEWRNADDVDVYLELKEKVKDFQTIPQIFWNDKYIGGYSDLVKEIEESNIGNYGQGTF